MEVQQRREERVYTGYNRTLRGKVYVSMPTILKARLLRIGQETGKYPERLPITEAEVVWLASDLCDQEYIPAIETGAVHFMGALLYIDNDYRDPIDPDWLLTAPVEEWLK